MIQLFKKINKNKNTNSRIKKVMQEMRRSTLRVGVGPNGIGICV